MRQSPRAKSPEVLNQLSTIAAEVSADIQPRPDKRAAARYGISRQEANRRRVYGSGPVRDVLELIACATPEEAMRVAGQVLAAARARALGGKSDAELVGIYRRNLAAEIDHEAEDRRLQLPGGTWRAKSRARMRDGSTDILLGSIENLFDARGLTEADVLARGHA